MSIADQIRKHKHENPVPIQRFSDPYGKPFKSLDPLWPRWGVLVRKGNTQWFRTKADAEAFLKTGDASRAVVVAPLRS